MKRIYFVRRGLYSEFIVHNDFVHVEGNRIFIGDSTLEIEGMKVLKIEDYSYKEKRVVDFLMIIAEMEILKTIDEIGFISKDSDFFLLLARELVNKNKETIFQINELDTDDLLEKADILEKIEWILYEKIIIFIQDSYDSVSCYSSEGKEIRYYFSSKTSLRFKDSVFMEEVLEGYHENEATFHDQKGYDDFISIDKLDRFITHSGYEKSIIKWIEDELLEAVIPFQQK